MKLPLIVAVTLLTTACDGSVGTTSAGKNAMSKDNPCAQYIATYDRCMGKLGPEAEKIAAQNLAAAEEQIRTRSDDVNLQARCKQSKSQVEVACQ